MSDLVAQFTTSYGRAPDVAWRAPGRVNLIGEHTDYNDGFVLPLAIPLDVRVAVGRRSDRLLRITSLQRGAEPTILSVDDLVPLSVEGWAAYVAGTIWALHQVGIALQGLDIMVDGEVPGGAGLSSSAALECAVAGAVASLAGVDISHRQIALAAQRAENEFVGVPCGIMDQFAVTHAVADHVLFLDTRNLETRAVPFAPQQHGLSLLVVDTRAPHRLVDGEYAERRLSCETAAALLGVAALRDITLSDLDAVVGRLDDDTLLRRVRHVVTENDRVLRVVAALDAKEIRSIGPILTASHVSLRDDFQVSSFELDVAVDAALEAGALGSRMTGGGFGGSAIALVESAKADAVTLAVRAAFAHAMLDEPTITAVTASAGFSPVDIAVLDSAP